MQGVYYDPTRILIPINSISIPAKLSQADYGDICNFAFDDSCHSIKCFQCCRSRFCLRVWHAGYGNKEKRRIRMQLKTLVTGAISLQLIDGATTYYSIKNTIGYEANPFLASVSPEILLTIKLIYALFLYALYIIVKDDKELKHYFHICIYCNILIYAIVAINNFSVIL